MSCTDGYVALFPETGLNSFEHKLCVHAANLASSGAGSVTEMGEDDLNPSGVFVGYDLDRQWLLIAGALVFFMQAGFALLEAGSVSKKNTVNILFKNLLDAAIGAIGFYLLGYGFAYGDSAGGFIGTSNFALTDEDGTGYAGWFFQWAFAATAATIVSGSVAERTKLSAYFIYSIVITTFIYPVVVHWGWGSGFLSAWGATNGPLFSGTDTSNGLIDFAGSGIVHLTGGAAGLVGAIVVGPRKGRFEVNEDGSFGAPLPMPGHSMVLNSLGVTILWFGWYGFNAGSTLCALGCMDLAGKVAVTTTLSAAAGSVTGVFVTKALSGVYDLDVGLNCVLAGLVGITAPCSVVEPWAAIIIGAISGLFYIAGDRLLLKLKIDDPLNASVVHGLCGIWGLLAVGIFGTDANVQYAAYPNTNGALASGEQFGVQVVGALAITGWVIATSTIVFVAIDKTIGMRVAQDVEEAGLDISEHDGGAYGEGLGKDNAKITVA